MHPLEEGGRGRERFGLNAGEVADEPGGLTTRMRVIMPEVARVCSVKKPSYGTIAVAVWKEA